MGREATGPCTIGAQCETVRALLESTHLILRGTAIKQRIALSDLKDVHVKGHSLRFTWLGEAVALELGSDEAQKWLKKINTPAPTLASKLGIGPSARALVLGDASEASDAALAQALTGATTTRDAEAAVLVAIVLSEADLEQALVRHAAMPCPAIWVVHLKGKAAVMGDTAIRTRLRGSGYMDNKTSAVSERFTATRYARR